MIRSVRAFQAHRRLYSVNQSTREELSRRFSVFTSRRTTELRGSDGLKARTVQSSRTSSVTWKNAAFLFKATRVPILITAIYSLGYQNGVVETVRNPLKIQQGNFEEICASFGVTGGDQVHIVAEKAKTPSLSRIGWIRRGDEEGAVASNDPRAKKVADIGRHVIRAARRYVREKLNEATDNAKNNLKDVEELLSEVEYNRRINAHDEVAEWLQALERVEGYSVDGVQNWQYILIGASVPNAFVSEMLPQRFFVTTGLFEKFVSNDDELAMILGHEISHLIMGHSSQRTLVEFLFRGLEITLLMLDPTEGMASLMVASFLGSSREALMAAHSRSNEVEADELGCKLAAMACFDTKRGVKVFQKMQEFDENQGGVKNSLMASHPASGDRYEAIQKLAQDENLAQYSYCDNLSRRLNRVLTAAFTGKK